ncbi:single-stranded DNA-binding protein [Kribbella sp. NPDC023855]|uniref:single-stranded DNA-binding protein n=1 Tax=Kribbella sp. NPDC023855 TaxID=3154698 RepID=UPI0033F7EADE
MSIGETTVAVQGWIGSDIRFKEVSDGVTVCSFRLATTPRQFDRAGGVWTDRPTNWFTVECWRNLAMNVRDSMERGHPIVVTGRFRTTEWQDEAGNPRSRLFIEAAAVGHDLSRGTATFTKAPARLAASNGASMDGGATSNHDRDFLDLSPGSSAQDDGPVDQEPVTFRGAHTSATTEPAETHEAA